MCNISDRNFPKSILAAVLAPPPFQPAAPQKAKPILLEVTTWENCSFGKFPILYLTINHCDNTSLIEKYYSFEI